MKRSVIFLSISLIVIFSMIAGLTTSMAQKTGSPAQPEIDLGEPGLSYRYVQTYGETGVPYFADSTHLNYPVGLLMDSSDNLYVTEDRGFRVLKYDSTPSNVLVLGKAGFSAWMGWGENLLYGPQDVALDQSGNIWVADINRVVQYDPSGDYLQQLPDDPWSSGDDNTHFHDAWGIALDSEGRMFVADTNNQRVQVYNLTSGSPVYSATIGITSEPGDDNNHFNQPYRIALDSLDQLYVADFGNSRVQKCTYASGWSCTLFDSGLNHPRGLAVDSSDHVYIADTDNSRIRKCVSGICSNFAKDTPRFADLAVDSAGNVYGTASDVFTVFKYDSTGQLVGPYIGVQGVPYLTDDYHYNSPLVSADAEGNILITEEFGHRLVKLDPHGNFLWSFGEPGVGGGDEEHLNSPMRVAADSSGKIYVPDRWSCRVQIISPDGEYLNTLGTGCGSGDYEFWSTTGVAVDPDGKLFVVDNSNQRVMIYDPDLAFIGQIGETWVCAADNDHLCSPSSVALDAAGNIFVTDSGNNRVQKFNSNLQWQMTIGDGAGGNRFDQFSSPEGITVDAQGRIYVSDAWNNRVQVFDATGAYLTTIGGAQGTSSAQFIYASSVAVNGAGSIFASDQGNSRIQIYAHGVPGWTQVNINGFGSPTTGMVTLEAFNDRLYAGTGDDAYGAQIWRTSNGTTWNLVTTPGEGIGDGNMLIRDMIEFGGNLYAGAGWGSELPEIWRATDGTDWVQVMMSTISDSSAFEAFAVFGDQLYAAFSDNADDGGVAIYRSSTGDVGSWSPVVTHGNGDVNNISIMDFALFKDRLYAVGGSKTTGAFVWQSSEDGNTWTQVNTPGFDDTIQSQAQSIAVFNGTLYVGTNCDEPLCAADFSEIWKSTNGTDWSLVVTDFQNGEHGDVTSLYTFNDALFAVVAAIQGNTVWKTIDGTNWLQVNPDGWGDSNSVWSAWDPAITAYDNKLYIATTNFVNGAEVWQYLGIPLYLPLISR